jgi:hypothetical protein
MKSKHAEEIKTTKASLDEHVTAKEELQNQIKELMSNKIAMEMKTKSANKDKTKLES